MLSILKLGASLCPLNHLQHLVLIVKVEPVAALIYSLDQSGPTAQHGRESIKKRAMELVNASLVNIVHCEVDASSIDMNVHACGTRQLYIRGEYGMKFS